MKTPSLLDSRKIVTLPVGAIKPNPHQPRRQFAPEELRELGESIRLYGILQPLTVRKTGPTTFELVAGERRLRAAVLVGMETVPCILLNVDSEQSGLLALVENLQRKDLDFIEEAEGLRSLIRSYGMSQEEAARCVSKSQSAVANKLRILKLPPALLTKLRDAGCTERHARALLRLETPEAQWAALEAILAGGFTVAKTEEYIENLLRAEPEEAPAPKKKRKAPVVVLKDVRIFLNTVTRGLSMMNRSGVRAVCERSDTDSELVLTIRIPRRERVSEGHEEHPAPA